MDILEEKVRALQGRKAKILDHDRHFKTAVILPLIHTESGINILFEKRSQNVHQPGEICFPGGRSEPSDRLGRNTAVRECCEELDLQPGDLEVIADLDIMVSPFNVLIMPFLAFIKNPAAIKPNADEVEKILSVPLQFFLDHEPLEQNLLIKVEFPEDFPLHLIPNGEKYPFRQGLLPQYFYEWDGEVIWGLTARILHHFIGMIKNK
ncbi:NUDIX hydrolase [Syntrophomonas palmitatica]|uniref:NUDIX hydrolase n=1 Tax=Syntrophomonas palmitatica TaxID=402877 RepID=UPI0006D0E415|nr:CoA pyrophosphatase [Syntrophomonas palmitatica]